MLDVLDFIVKPKNKETLSSPRSVRFCGVREETLSSHWILAFAKTPNATCIPTEPVWSVLLILNFYYKSKIMLTHYLLFIKDRLVERCKNESLKLA